MQIYSWFEIDALIRNRKNEEKKSRGTNVKGFLPLVTNYYCQDLSDFTQFQWTFIRQQTDRVGCVVGKDSF